MTSTQSPQTPLPIALTMGDPAGISTEITTLAWQRRVEHALSPFFVLSRQSLFEELSRLDGFRVPLTVISSPDEALEAFAHSLPILELPDEVEYEPGQPDRATGAMTVHSISSAVQYVKQGHASSIVTNPINKHVLYEAGFNFPGHTEYLAEKSGGSHPVMMLATPTLRVALVTTHAPLSAIPAMITEDLIIEVTKILDHDLRFRFKLKDPQIAVCGLNPHAGEDGHLGREEIDTIIPALKKLTSLGINVRGPLPADTAFTPHQLEQADVVLAMYHDQGLPVLKHQGFGDAVNVTLGLPVIRTSVDHGTALDLAGTGKVDEGSLYAAIEMAIEMTTKADA